EFGGRGNNPGWFYHPTLLDVDQLGLVYIGQIFQNKIQVCRTPEFIRKSVTPSDSDQGDVDIENLNTYFLGWLQSTLHVKGGTPTNEDKNQYYERMLVSAPESNHNPMGKLAIFGGN
ncbi:MAG: hypothetical protein OEV80_18690, partial [candidate division Zixibacteria bacterium]|nr:hypothetical protein [candidate division Zixibacteria bacterium]